MSSGTFLASEYLERNVWVNGSWLFDRSLKRELVRAQEEIKRIQSVPLVIGQFMEAIDQKYALYSHVGSNGWTEWI